MNKTEFIESMKVLNIKPGDIIVCKTPMVLSEKAVIDLKKSLKETLAFFGHPDQKIIVLEQGMDIGTIRFDEDP